VLPPDPAEVARRARLLLTALARMGLSAFTPGERDLAIGPALLRRLLAEAKIPVVAANLFDDKGKRLFDATRMIEVAGVKIGVFGVIRAAPEDAALWASWRLQARDPIAAAREQVAALRARGATLIVALLHVGAFEQAKTLLLQAPGIDWAVLGHSAMNFETPEAVGDARALEAMSMGKDFGRLDLHVLDGATQRPIDRGQRAQLQAILADHQRQIADLRQRGAAAPQPATQKYFADRITEMEKSIARDTTLLKAQPVAIKGSWFENRIMPLDTATPDHPAIAALVTQYNRESQRRAAAGLPVGVLRRSAQAARPVPASGSAGTTAATAPEKQEDVRYAGTIACGGCHADELAFWRTTPHARALDTLRKKKRDRDPTCVGCHVTGFLRPGGTGDLALATARLRDVGCEACHGPGLDHIAKPPGAITRRVEPAVCRGCHTADQTNGDFDYATFVKAILGAGHGGV
jgi:predicted CXXCH cytochrome family protein